MQKREAREFEQQLKGERQERIRDLDLFGIMLSPEQEQELKQQAQAQKQRVQEFARGLDVFDLEVSPDVERQRRAEGAFDLRLHEQAEDLQTPRGEQDAVRLRREMAASGIASTEARESQIAHVAALREQHERLNMAVQLWGDLSQGIGSAWVSALQSIAAGTMTRGAGV